MYRSPWYSLGGYLACTVIENGIRRTILAHREIMEKVLGRPLTSDEIVHHKDQDKRNNDPSNLEVVNRSDHARMHMFRGGAKMIDLKCLRCGTDFIRAAYSERHNRKMGKDGPFCSRSCGAKGRP